MSYQQSAGISFLISAGNRERSPAVSGLAYLEEAVRARLDTWTKAAGRGGRGIHLEAYSAKFD